MNSRGFWWTIILPWLLDTPIISSVRLSSRSKLTLITLHPGAVKHIFSETEKEWMATWSVTIITDKRIMQTINKWQAVEKNAFVPYHILFQRWLMQPAVESANFNVYLKFCIAWQGSKSIQTAKSIQWIVCKMTLCR